MKVFKSYDLYSKNTMRLHCSADIVYQPESTSELINLIHELKSQNKTYRMISGGSNIILPPKMSEPVILMDAFDNRIEYNEGYVEVGASTRMQKFIRSLQEHSLGGMEYLFSVPCLVGGGVLMNAGRGKKFNKSISNHIISVKVLEIESMKIIELSNEECHFAHRSSLFQNRGYVILSAKMKFQISPAEEIETRIQERLQTSRAKLDASKPSCGSVFSRANGYIMKLLKGLRIGGACWSKKTSNWISNDHNGTYKNVVSLVKVAKFFHKLTFQPIHQEIEIW